jgi:nitronate monooxygenase
VWTNKMAGTNSSVLRTPLVEEGGLRVNAVLAFLLRHRWTKSMARMFLLRRSLEAHKKAAFDGSIEYWQAGKGVGGIAAVEPAGDIVRRFGAALEQARAA